MHLPPAQSEIYEGPKNEWLKDVLEQLPNLQSLIVSQLPFFDHAALLALRQPSTHHVPLESVEETQSMLDVDRLPQRSASTTRRSISSTSRQRLGFPLRLLIATRCANTTSTGLAEGLSHWTNLVFLDLSETLAARDHAVLSSFHHMAGLQILKLRHVNFRDEDIDVLAEAIGIRVRSLDVRDNKITDTSVRKLLNSCFPSAQEPMINQGSLSNALPGVSDEDWQCGVRKPMSYLLDEFLGNDIDQRFVKRLTGGMVSRLPSEDLPAVGLTHLYVANNYLTVEGIASLIKSGNLNVLDVGSVDTAKALVRPRARSTSSRQLEFSKLLPGAEKLIPILGHHAAKNLTYLRIHHAVVTQKAPVSSDNSSWAQLNKIRADKHELATEDVPSYELEDGGKQELPTEEAPSYELEANPLIHEIGDNNGTPRFELPGDPIQFVVSQALGKKPSPTPEERTSSDVRRGSIYAPEPVIVYEGYKAKDGSSHLHDARDVDNVGQAVNEVSVEEQESTGSLTATSQRDAITIRPVHRDSRPTLTSVKERRRNLRSGNNDEARGLSPGALPALRSLALTDVPCTHEDHHVIDALKRFLQDCAEEVKLAELQALIEQETLHLPGPFRSVQQHYRPRELFALQSLVLEMAAPKYDNTSKFKSTTLPNSSSGSSTDRCRSSTEDPDTEAFWAAQENDFSFFGDEERGLPAEEPGMHFPLSMLSEKVVMPTDTLHPGDLTLQQPSNSHIGVDVVQELSKFRRERKAAYERALSLGEKYVDGYWPGEVKIIRHKGGDSHQNGWDYFSNDVYY